MQNGAIPSCRNVSTPAEANSSQCPCRSQVGLDGRIGERLVTEAVAVHEGAALGSGQLRHGRFAAGDAALNEDGQREGSRSHRQDGVGHRNLFVDGGRTARFGVLKGIVGVFRAQRTRVRRRAQGRTPEEQEQRAYASCGDRSQVQTPCGILRERSPGSGRKPHDPGRHVIGWSSGRHLRVCHDLGGCPLTRPSIECPLC